MAVRDDIQLDQASVLGSMLLAPKIIGSVLGQLRPEDFTGEDGPAMYRAIRALYLEDGKIDVVTVLNRMGRTPQHQAFVLAVMDATPTAANWQEYTRIVREQAQLRQVQATALAIASAGTDLDQARELVGQLEQLVAGREEIECLSMEQCLLRFMDNMQRKPDYLPWGLDFLDQGLMVEPGDFILLGGNPSSGKTALALAMAWEQAKTKRVGFFSLETQSDELFFRLVSTVCEINSSHIRRRTLDKDDYQVLAERSDDIRGNNLHLLRRGGTMTTEDIVSVAKAKQFDIIYIDYITLIAAPGRDEYQQTTTISKSLHRAAQDLGITIVALSQFSRTPAGENRTPTMSSFRSSGQLEQDADVAMLLYKEDENNIRSRRILRVAKNKKGLTGQVVLQFDGDTQRFRPDINQEVKKPPKREAKSKQMTFEELSDADPNFPL